MLCLHPWHLDKQANPAAKVTGDPLSHCLRTCDPSPRDLWHHRLNTLQLSAGEGDELLEQEACQLRAIAWW